MEWEVIYKAKIFLPIVYQVLEQKYSWRKEMFYLMMHSAYIIYGYMALDIW